MPPKAKKPPAAAASGNYYEEQQIADDIAILEEKLKALKAVYLSRMEVLAGQKQRQLDLEAVLHSREAELHAKQDEKTDVLADCTRVYKIDEQKAVQEVALLDSSLNGLQEARRQMQDQLDDVSTDLDARIKSRKKEYEALCERTEDMEKEFAVLLSDVEHSAPL